MDPVYNVSWGLVMQSGRYVGVCTESFAGGIEATGLRSCIAGFRYRSTIFYLTRCIINLTYFYTGSVPARMQLTSFGCSAKVSESTQEDPNENPRLQHKYTK